MSNKGGGVALGLGSTQISEKVGVGRGSERRDFKGGRGT